MPNTNITGGNVRCHCNTTVIYILTILVPVFRLKILWNFDFNNIMLYCRPIVVLDSKYKSILIYDL